MGRDIYNVISVHDIYNLGFCHAVGPIFFYVPHYNVFIFVLSNLGFHP